MLEIAKYLSWRQAHFECRAWGLGLHRSKRRYRSLLWGALGRILICASLCLFLPAAAWAGLNYNPNSLRGVSTAYGFILGQEASLARIEQHYPSMAMQVELARLRFSSAFPDIKMKLERELISAMGESKFRELRAELGGRIDPILRKQQLTPDLAASFLEEVKGRAKGDFIEADALRYLLAVRYSVNPAGEFFDGFRQRYSTNSHAKSQGIKLMMQLPRSWLGKEGERPHIVQKWVSESGTGPSMIMLDVRDAEGYNPTRVEIEQLVRNGELKDIIPEGGKYLDGGSFSLEKRTGYWIESAIDQERAGIRLHQRGVMYIFFFRGKAIGLTCASLAPQKESKRVDGFFKLNKPLCQQVLNSIVLEQAY